LDFLHSSPFLFPGKQLVKAQIRINRLVFPRIFLGLEVISKGGGIRGGNGTPLKFRLIFYRNFKGLFLLLLINFLPLFFLTNLHSKEVLSPSLIPLTGIFEFLH